LPLARAMTRPSSITTKIVPIRQSFHSGATPTASLPSHSPRMARSSPPTASAFSSSCGIPRTAVKSPNSPARRTPSNGYQSIQRSTRISRATAPVSAGSRTPTRPPGHWWRLPVTVRRMRARRSWGHAKRAVAEGDDWARGRD
jgi:hypothetical protein